MTVSRRALLKGASALAVAVATGPLLARPRRPVEPRIDALVAAMSLEEKAGQLSIYSDPVRNDGAAVNPGLQQQGLVELKARVARGELTGLFNGSGVVLGRELQRVAVEESRSKIPLIFAGDVIHGFRTQFPIPLGEAASFDPALAERTARAAALEATARGIHWTFAPMVDVARDERWGRVVEGSGEDPWLGTQLGVARVRGFQGRDLRDPTSMLACPKHFAAYGAVQGGMEYNTADIPLTTLWQVHLPPFRAAFDAGAITTMASFNDIAGVPSTGSHYLLTEVLRDRWRFGGLVVSDYTGDEEMILHGYAADGPDAAAKAITAGCDMSMQSGFYWKYLPDLVRAGRVPVAVVDEAVRRVLRVKQALGLLDDPYRSLDPAREASGIGRPETVALAREAARRSCVLLKNEGDLLPLAKTRSVALIGPSVSDRADLPGPWAVFPDVANHVTVAEAGAATGKPLVVLLRHGRALALTGAVRAAPAIMATWFLGSQTGHAIADLVFGDHAPEGRLPVSFPQASGQEPFYYDHRNTGRPQLTADHAYKARYREVTNTALYPFGHGLGYAAASYGPTRVAAPAMARGGTLRVSATVANTGARPLHEVAQLYVHDCVASITQPVRVLRGVRHLDLAPGASATVTFDLAEADLAYVHADLANVADPGVFDVWIAPSSAGGTPASFTLG